VKDHIWERVLDMSRSPPVRRGRSGVRRDPLAGRWSPARREL